MGLSTGGLASTFSEEKAISLPVGQLDKGEVVAVHVEKALVLTSLLIVKARNQVDNGRDGVERAELSKTELITVSGLRGRQNASSQYEEVKEVQHDPQPVAQASGLAAIWPNSCVQKGLISSVGNCTLAYEQQV